MWIRVIGVGIEGNLFPVIGVKAELIILRGCFRRAISHPNSNKNNRKQTSTHYNFHQKHAHSYWLPLLHSFFPYMLINSLIQINSSTRLSCHLDQTNLQVFSSFVLNTDLYVPYFLNISQGTVNVIQILANPSDCLHSSLEIVLWFVDALFGIVENFPQLGTFIIESWNAK